MRDYIDLNDSDGEIDVIKMIIGSKRMASEDAEAVSLAITKPKKAYQSRTTFPRKDPRQSAWWTDYVIDVENKYDNPNKNRFYQMFKFRFSLQAKANTTSSTIV